MKKNLLFCIMAMTILLSACSGASGNINKAFDIVKQKGDANKVYEYITSSPIDYEKLSMEEMAKLGICSMYIQTSSWGHADEQTREKNKVLGEMSEETMKIKRTWTPEQQREFMEIVKELTKEDKTK